MTERLPHSVVVGGTRGHGRAWVRLLCAKGHAVSVVGRRPPADADRELPNVRFFGANLAQPKAVARVRSQIAARGPLDTMVFFQRHRGSGDPWNSELAVSLSATNALITGLRDRFATDGARSIVLIGGSIVNLVAHEQPAGYHVAKAGMYSLVRYYAVILGPEKLRVNMVSPGSAIKEESQAFFASHKKLRDLYDRATPLGRMGTSKDVIGAVDFLCSPQANFITGHNLIVDGGMSLLWQETLARRTSPLAGLRVTRRK
jgi:NAD(P)-dependent dehydrogenase (short-subunit alcohol dehydrogenase family)